MLEFSKNLLSANQHGISLSPDGMVLAAPGKAGMTLWDVATGKELQSIGAQRFVWICFSPDGNLLATQGGSQFVDCNIWDSRSGNNLCAWTMAAGADFATPPLFTKDSKTLITAHRDKTIRFWDIATGQERHKVVLDWKDPRQLVLSPDGKTVAASAYQSENIHLIDVAEARVRFRIAAPDRTDENGRKERFTEIAFTTDGKALVAAGIDRSLIFFDPTTGKEQRRLEKEFHSVFCMALSPDGKTVASAIGGKLIRLTDLASGRDLIPTSGHWAGVWSATFAEGGKLVATVGGGNDIFLWDAVTGREVRRLKGHTAGVTSVALTLDGRLLRSVGADKTVRYWDPNTGKQTRQSNGIGNGWNQTRSLDGRIVVATTSSAKVSALSAFDSETGTELWRQDSDHAWYGSTFSGDGTTLVGWSGDRTIHLLDPNTGRKTKQYPIDAGGGGGAYFGVTLSNDGKVLACGSQRATLAIVDAATGKTLHYFKGLPDGVSAIAFSPDDKMLAWGGWNDPRIHLIELATGMERRIFSGTTGRVLNLSFSPDGKKLLSGSEDTTATVWDLTGRLGKPNLAKSLTAAEIDALWDALADGDAAKAYRAMQALADSPRNTVLYLGKRITSVPRESDRKLVRLIADLDSGDFQTRDRATAELDKLGEAALGAYDAALAATPSLEARRRIEALKAKHDPWRPSPDRLRAMRALETLEMCGAEARDLLAILSQGAPGSYSAEHARVALRRLAVP